MLKKKIIIDGTLVLYRAYYALPLLFNNKGKATGATCGFIKIFKKIIHMYSTNDIIVIFDAPGITFRKKIFTKYKIQRQKIPYNLRMQITPLKDIIKAMGYKVISINNIEADDIIGTITTILTKKKYVVYIFSSDKDLAQLVSNTVYLINPIKYNILGPKEIYQKYGVYPKLMSDFLALCGDKTDNIPGIPGIGIKTSQLLLNNFGSIKYIYSKIYNPNYMNNTKMQNLKLKLIMYQKEVFLYHKLTTINTNINLQGYYP
ncbi:5'-3' exonuclease [Enterobacteriaceae endosymbiont of Macroplea appendiculata]|uniref:5'-3' exonuclease n=1 Tax=Enterobacteriaceae endosymbiont of Macroplea appendiculata TaxID=2675790 RepID=UPI001448F5D1|nr:5'-3' exonuclease H3TH domain-containing protein [Enterobacteriaceae endosymbiont of Macroplea appendiculata]QJC30980.1 flap endonuclease [Enterobacteriaceae endosymbiont of Macroplea appendiculata]